MYAFSTIMFVMLVVVIWSSGYILDKQHDALGKQITEIKDKIKNLEDRQLIVLSTLQDISDILIHGRTKDMEEELNKMEKDINEFKQKYWGD